MSQKVFPDVNVDLGGLSWTASYTMRQITIRASHPAMDGFSFEKSYPISPNDFDDAHRADRTSALMLQAARSLGLKVD